MKSSKKQKKLVKVPEIKPDLWIEVDSDISDQDLQVKINRILEAKKKDDESIKISKYYSKQTHPFHYSKYTGPIYSLSELKSTIHK